MTGSGQVMKDLDGVPLGITLSEVRVRETAASQKPQETVAGDPIELRSMGHRPDMLAVGPDGTHTSTQACRGRRRITTGAWRAIRRTELPSSSGPRLISRASDDPRTVMLKDPAARPTPTVRRGPRRRAAHNSTIAYG